MSQGVAVTAIKIVQKLGVEDKIDNLRFVSDIITGGKTDHTERASTICHYFEKPGRESDVYNILINRYNESN